MTTPTITTALTLSTLSRYKDTTVYANGGVLEFGLWNAPAEFGNLPLGSLVHQVRSYEIGMLDLLAVRYFGPGYECMWWAIAQANGIQDPEIDMYVGQSLIIPPRAALSSFASRAGLAQ